MSGNTLSVINEEALGGLIEEIDALITEKVYEFQQAKIDLFWLTGEALRKFEKENGTGITELVLAVARDNRLSNKQMGERNLFWALKIYDKYPTREFPDDKATSLTKIKKQLTDGKDEECEHEETVMECHCKKCHKKL